MMVILRWRVLGLIVLAVVATGARGSDGPGAKVDAVLRTPGYETGHWGLLAVDARTGQEVYARNPDDLFAPASVTKLFTTAAALAELGADFRFRTPVHRRGEVDASGTLQGDLILVASGDPSLGGRTGPDGTMLFADDDHSYAVGNFHAAVVAADPLAGLDLLAREVAAGGIKAVSGDVLIDDRLFDPAASTGSGPSRVSPVVINDAIVDVEVTPGARAGDPAAVRVVPATAFVGVDAQVTTGAEGSPPSLSVEPVGPRRFTVRGSLPVGHRPAVTIYEVEEPASFARALLIEALRKQGVRVGASPLGVNATAALPPRDEVATLPKMAEYASPPFREYLKVILKVSQNLHASLLPPLLASRAGERTLAAGLRREAELLKGLGIDLGAVSFGGGAGGSRSDLATPRATVTLLKAMAARPDFSAFEAALPVLGRDGTLARAVAADSPARGHVRAKTGTYWVEDGLTGRAILTSKAMAGYMETASGRPLIFATFVNNVPLSAPASDASEATAAASRLLGKVCEALYDDKPSPSPCASPRPGG